jgi:drug/metabolite transporter (DMT)-like permease
VRKEPNAGGVAGGVSAPAPHRQVDASVWGALLTIYVVWGSTFAAIELAVRTIPPFLTMASRHLVAGTILLVWGLVRERERIGRRQVLAATVFGGALFLGSHGLLAWSQQRIPSGVAALLVASIPLWVAVLDRLVFGRRLSRRAVLGLAVGFGGVALLVDPWGGGPIDTVGALVAVVSAASWAAGSLYARGAPLPRGPIVSAGLASLAGGVLLLLASTLRGESSGLDPAAISGESIFGVVYLIVVGSLVGLTAYVWLLKVAPISLVATYAYVNPVVAVLIGWAILDERFTLSMLLAGALIVAAVALIVSAPVPAREHGRGLLRRAGAAEIRATR